MNYILIYSLHFLYCGDSTLLNSSQRLFTNLEGLINLKNCYYTRFLLYSGSQSRGSILYISSNLLNTSLMIEECTFFQCHASYEAGAIFFQTLGESNLKKICALECVALQYSHFATIVTKNAISFSNNFYLSSIMKCSPYLGYGRRCMYFAYSNQTQKHLNISNNYAYDTSGIMYEVPKSLSISYINILNNDCNLHLTLRFHSINNQGTFFYSNIINNTSPSYGVLYFLSSSFSFSSCFFSCHVSTQKIFALESSTVVVTNSIIDHHASYITTSGTVLIDTSNYKTTQFNQFSLDLNHLNDNYCKNPINHHELTF